LKPVEIILVLLQIFSSASNSNMNLGQTSLAITLSLSPYSFFFQNRPRGGKRPAKIFSGFRRSLKTLFLLSYAVGIEGKEEPEAEQPPPSLLNPPSL
jgi:hypothetical protein